MTEPEMITFKNGPLVSRHTDCTYIGPYKDMLPKLHSTTRQTLAINRLSPQTRTRVPSSLPRLPPSKLSPRLYSSAAYPRTTMSSSATEPASATRINLFPATDSGVFSAGIREDTARLTSSLLQDDMEKHHVFFNDQGFHSMYLYLIFL
jgi:hypothetical protein